MCTSFVAKLILGLVNTLILLVGLAMFAIGIVLQKSADFSQEALSDVLDLLKTSASSAGVTLDTSAFSAADVAFAFSICLIVFGIFLAGVSVLGLIAVTCGLKPLVIVYFVMTLVLFLAQLVLVLIAVIDRDTFNGTVKPYLKDTITDNYSGLDGTNGATQIWNGIMIKLKCCGVDDYNDFSSAANWDKELNGASGFVTPVACCQTISNSYTCAQSPSDSNNYWKTGCYDKIWDYVIEDSGIVTGLVAGILAFQLAILILSCLVMHSMGKVTDIV